MDSSLAGEVLAVRLPAHMLALSASWHAIFFLARLICRTRARCLIRPLCHHTTDSDEWVTVESGRLSPCKPSELLPPLASMYLVQQLSAAAIDFLDCSLEQVTWHAGTTGYRFGSSQLLQTDRAHGVREELRAMCEAQWGEGFWDTHTLDCSDGHFLMYQEHTETPPWHFDIKGDLT